MVPEKAWKFCYWMPREIFNELSASLKAQGREPVPAKQNPCEALLADIGYAEPETWPVICTHDAAPWYRHSKHSGKILVVSSRELAPAFDGYLETTITPVDFEPPYLPTDAEQKALVENPAYLARQPEGWGAFPPETGQAIVSGLARVFGSKTETFKDLLQTWTAVHANFACPAYRSGDAFGNAPYSIADSVHMSTCCVEMFNLIDTSEKALLVRPCVGAVIVKAFEQNRYYLVRPVK